MTTWRAELEAVMQEDGETWADMVAYAPPGPEAEVFDVEFDDGYGGHNGPRFTVWTKKRVYFPVVYDGAEWVSSVPRDPCDECTAHVGGE